MVRLRTGLRAAFDAAFPRTGAFRGAAGRVWLAGAVERGPSIAAFFGGDDPVPDGQGRCRRSGAVPRAEALGAAGTVAILFPGGADPAFPDPDRKAIVAPLRIALRKSLPATTGALRADIKNSTTQEDLRRIRKAGFTFRTTRDPDRIREFHARHYAPLIAHRFPEDGWIMSADDLVADLDRGGEVLCADRDGEWVAGLYNWAGGDSYRMGPLGIRDADDGLRQMRVVSALLVGSMERAVTLGLKRATLGHSVPFLGKGPIWFKAKWGCTLHEQPDSPVMQMFLDLRHDGVRQALADSPVIFRDGGALAAAAWLMPGDGPLRTLLREAGRFPGLSRWHVLGDPATIDGAADALRGHDRLSPMPVPAGSPHPLWLGQLVAGGCLPDASAALS